MFCKNWYGIVDVPETESSREFAGLSTTSTCVNKMQSVKYKQRIVEYPPICKSVVRTDKYSVLKPYWNLVCLSCYIYSADFLHGGIDIGAHIHKRWRASISHILLAYGVWM